jgi:hypothetical protein
MLVLAGLGEVVVPGDLPSLVTQLEKMIIFDDPQQKLFFDETNLVNREPLFPTLPPPLQTFP